MHLVIIDHKGTYIILLFIWQKVLVGHRYLDFQWHHCSKVFHARQFFPKKVISCLTKKLYKVVKHPTSIKSSMKVPSAEGQRHWLKLIFINYLLQFDTNKHASFFQRLDIKTCRKIKWAPKFLRSCTVYQPRQNGNWTMIEHENHDTQTLDVKAYLIKERKKERIQHAPQDGTACPDECN